jgi:hypothetical protein
MSKKHFFLFDFVLPLAVILAIGKFLSLQFDTSVFMSLDKIRAFGFGMMFSHSPARALLWNYSFVLFAAAPALLWLIWVRINVEFDYMTNSRRLDRPLYGFMKSLMRWVDDDDGGKFQLQTLEFRAVQAEDRARKLEAELMRTRQEVADLERENQDLEDELAADYDTEAEVEDAQAN